MNLLKDLWAHIKEWSDWKMKDWIKAAIVAIIVIVGMSPAILIIVASVLSIIVVAGPAIV